MRTLDPIRRTQWIAAALAVAVAVVVAGCGGDELADEERDPPPTTLSAAITRSSVTVSPSRVGAGKVELIASNLTSRSQQLTLASRSVRAGGEPVRQRTGPINPGDTASLTVELAEGTYRLTATGSGAIAAATLRVGPQQPADQDQLLQP